MSAFVIVHLLQCMTNKIVLICMNSECICYSVFDAVHYKQHNHCLILYVHLSLCVLAHLLLWCLYYVRHVFVTSKLCTHVVLVYMNGIQ